MRYCSNPVCSIAGKILFLLLIVADVAAIVGVYKAHVVAGGATFGSTTGSLSLLAFAVTTHIMLKLGCKMCPGSCGCGSGCGSCCGSGCGCGDASCGCGPDCSCSDMKK